MSRDPGGNPALSVIVPVLNEERSLPSFLQVASAWPGACELIFVDGGSADRTLELLAGYEVRSGAHGRGAQCRLGASAAKGRGIAFVHADSIVPAESVQAIVRALDRGVPWGCLTLRFVEAGPILALGAIMSNMRVKLTGIPFGDQVMFMSRSLYDQVGGMPDLPLMEDYELSRRLVAIARPKQLRERVFTSARRFKAGGVFRTMLKMRHLRHLYRAGVPAGELAIRYGEGR